MISGSGPRVAVGGLTTRFAGFRAVRFVRACVPVVAPTGVDVSTTKVRSTGKTLTRIVIAPYWTLLIRHMY